MRLRPCPRAVRTLGSGASIQTDVVSVSGT